MFKYRRAFERNDGERYHAFMDRVTKGQEKLNTGTLFPYEIIEKAYDWNGEDRLQVPDDTTIRPWGWSAAICHQLRQAGVQESLLPSLRKLEQLRHILLYQRFRRLSAPGAVFP